MKEAFPKTRWHRLLGRLLELLLTPVGIQVETELAVMSEPPRADILLLRRHAGALTSAQRARLADGLRDTRACHMLLEFKRTEGLSERAWRQILAYDHLYQQARNLRRDELASFLVSGSTPRGGGLLRELGYLCAGPAGVYCSKQPLVRHLGVILLNELGAEPHNAALKCFATGRREQAAALVAFRTSGLWTGSLALEELVIGLWRILMKNAPEIEELTPEYVMQAGKEFLEAFLEASPPEMVLRHYSPEQRLAGLDPEQRLAGLDPETIRRYLEGLEQKKGH